MKTFVSLVLLTACALCSSAPDTPVSVYVDGKLQSYQPSAILRGGSVYVLDRAWPN